MWVVVLWLIFAVLVGVYADSKNRNGVAWGILSILLSPLLCWLMLLAIGQPGPNANTHKRCPSCAEWCANEARVCKHCGNSFEQPYKFTGQQGKSVGTGDFMG